MPSHIERTFDALNSVKSLVDLVSSSLVKEVDKVQVRLQTVTPEFLGRGLASLPNEVFLIIIEMAAVPHIPGQQALALSHVSRRFRYAAVLLPRIWTNLSSEFLSHNLARLYARRSKGKGIDVSLDDYHKEAQSTLLFHAAIPHCSNWRSLSYNGYDRHHSSLSVELRKRKRYLPRLELLTVSNDFDDLYLAYDMPNLQSAHFTHRPPYPFSSSITKFTMDFDSSGKPEVDADDNEDEDFFTRRLGHTITFLEDTPSIKDFTLRFGAYSSLCRDVPFATLENIEMFRMELSIGALGENYDGPYEAALEFIDAVKMPKLKQLSLCVELDQVSHLLRAELNMYTFGEVLEHLIPKASSSPLLSSLELNIISKLSDQEEMVLNDGQLVISLECISKVSSLTVKTNLKGVSFHSRTPEGDISLRRLEFADCPQLNTVWYLGLTSVQEIASPMNSEPSRRQVDVIVRGCPGLKGYSFNTLPWVVRIQQMDLGHLCEGEHLRLALSEGFRLAVPHERSKMLAKFDTDMKVILLVDRRVMGDGLWDGTSYRF